MYSSRFKPQTEKFSLFVIPIHLFSSILSWLARPAEAEQNLHDLYAITNKYSLSLVCRFRFLSHLFFSFYQISATEDCSLKPRLLPPLEHKSRYMRAGKLPKPTYTDQPWQSAVSQPQSPWLKPPIAFPCRPLKK